jgi:hypothetical protein
VKNEKEKRTAGTKDKRHRTMCTNRNDGRSDRFKVTARHRNLLMAKKRFSWRIIFLDELEKHFQQKAWHVILLVPMSAFTIEYVSRRLSHRFFGPELKTSP